MTQTRPVTHPAKYSESVIPAIKDMLIRANRADVRAVDTVLDPFAGTGRIHQLRPVFTTTGLELEPEWASMSPHTIVGDALKTPFPGGTFDAVASSPTYGNRMADKDMRPSCAGTYMKGLGRQATNGSSCHMQWGDEYRKFHRLWLAEMYRVLRGKITLDGWTSPGWLILNISDHYRNNERQPVTAWFIECARQLGFQLVDLVPVETPRLTRGANGKRVDAEMVILFRKSI
jgi:hypothetical protein